MRRFLGKKASPRCSGTWSRRQHVFGARVTKRTTACPVARHIRALCRANSRGARIDASNSRNLPHYGRELSATDAAVRCALKLAPARINEVVPPTGLQTVLVTVTLQILLLHFCPSQSNRPPTRRTWNPANRGG
jgi:hypothetical protein